MPLRQRQGEVSTAVSVRMVLLRCDTDFCTDTICFFHIPTHFEDRGNMFLLTRLNNVAKEDHSLNVITVCGQYEIPEAAEVAQSVQWLRVIAFPSSTQPTLRICGVVPLLPYTPSWRRTRGVLLTVYIIQNRPSDSLRAGPSKDRIPVVAIFSAPVQTVPAAHPASYSMHTGSFPRGKAAGAWR
jgi:hypothetical protein